MPVDKILALMGLLVNHAPAMTAVGVKLWADVAHGEGGLQKVQKAARDFANLVDAAATGNTPAAG